MRVYLLVMLIAAAVTFLTTPFARWFALRTNAITKLRDRDVHTIPTPRMGGLAMLLGLAISVAFASKMPFLALVFQGANLNMTWGIVGAAAIVCLLGMADDLWDLDWMTKLAGQILAAGFLAWQGVSLGQIAGPDGGIWVQSYRMGLFATILVVVIAMNAVNFVDGLDGLAAGVIAIGGSAYFLYTYVLTKQTNPEDYSSLASMITAALVGVCLGFLPHNFNPARIFMGDAGSMVLGLVIAAAAIVVVGNFDPGVDQSRRIPALMPLLLPMAVILLPLLDMGLAVVRRLAKGQSPFHPDALHLHHRMLAIGHSHRRAVVILYMWTAIFAFGTAALVFPIGVHTVLIGLGVAIVVGLFLTLGPLRTRGKFLDDVELPATEPVPLVHVAPDAAWPGGGGPARIFAPQSLEGSNEPHP